MCKGWFVCVFKVFFVFCEYSTLCPQKQSQRTFSIILFRTMKFYNFIPESIRLLLQPPVSGVAVSLLVSGLTVDILSTFCGVLMLQCVMLMLRIFEFGVLLFDCFVHRQNVTCLKRFYQVWAYAGEVEDIIIGRLAVVSSVTAEKLQRLAAV